MVHWPEPKMPTAVGPFSFSTRFHCRAISSKAWSHETGWNSPSLASVFHAHQRRGEPIGAVHDLREEVALDAVEPAIDLRLHVAVSCNDLSVLDADHHAAPGAAEAARRLGPFKLNVRPGRDVLRLDGQADARRRCGRAGGLGFEERAA